MAMISCSECRNDVSDKATSCPHCGAPIAGAAEAKGSGANLTTTQGTSKKLKLHAVLSMTLFIVGLAWIYVVGSADEAPAAGSITPGVVMTVVGGVWYLATRVRRWWHHD